MSAEVTSIKVTLVGDSGVGKTSLLEAMKDNELTQNYSPTIGANYEPIKYSYKNKEIVFNFWDTAGQEKYTPLTPSYLRGSQFVLVCYEKDVSDTFDNARKKWINIVKESIDTNYKIVLVETKNDLENVDEPDLTETAEKYAKNEGFGFFSTCAITKDNVDCILAYLSQQSEEIINSVENETNSVNHGNINKENTKTPTACC